MAKDKTDMDLLCVNAIRGLAMDAVQKANSGHPGMPMGAAAFAYALWSRHLKHDPSDPCWFDRDRFILSAGHGSMLLYALLHLSGYDLSLDEIRNFRQWGSKTPGHPENHLTPGVEMATGPLGQGISTAVGFALAERYLAARYNRPGLPVVDHHTYVLCSDGDLMEGVSNEAASFAGHQKLGKLICLYDDNGITIDGPTSRTFTEDVTGRFLALGWHVIEVDGLDVEAVSAAIEAAKAETGKPSLIRCKTVIGYGSPNKAGKNKAHGAPLGPEEVVLAKRQLGLSEEPFAVPESVYRHFADLGKRGAERNRQWHGLWDRYAREYPSESAELEASLSGEIPCDWRKVLPVFEEKVATRVASGKVLNAIAPHFPNLIGGTADLGESVMTDLTGHELLQAETPDGRNIAFGVREHAMAAILNGMNLHGGVRAFGGTFLVFSDYCRPSIRLAALMRCPTVFVFTHDSVGVGEDGPTHQPIEHLASLRAIPNLNVMRPADGNETSACWKVALESRETPCVLALTRQAVPTVTPATVASHPAEKGGYILNEPASGAARLVILASGSEVSVALEAQKILESWGIATRVVSMPSVHLFERQSQAYREHVLPSNVPAVAVEAGATLGWYKYADAVVGIDRFGASAPGPRVLAELGITPENVARVAKEVFDARD
ncbi:MAG: transketolase [Fimbriimonadales bacterium]|nr:transketolase [Fimbriimonadales bacterium]